MYDYIELMEINGALQLEVDDLKEKLKKQEARRWNKSNDPKDGFKYEIVDGLPVRKKVLPNLEARIWIRTGLRLCQGKITKEQVHNTVARFKRILMV